MAKQSFDNFRELFEKINNETGVDHFYFEMDLKLKIPVPDGTRIRKEKLRITSSDNKSFSLGGDFYNEFLNTISKKISDKIKYGDMNEDTIRNIFSRTSGKYEVTVEKKILRKMQVDNIRVFIPILRFNIYDGANKEIPYAFEIDNVILFLTPETKNAAENLLKEAA
jgi:hypothetical protein